MADVLAPVPLSQVFGKAVLQQEVRAVLEGKDLAQTSLKEVCADLELRLGLGPGQLDPNVDEIQRLAKKEAAKLSPGTVHALLATPEKKKVVAVDAEGLQQEIRAVLQGKDLAQTSLKEVRADLESRLGMSPGALDSNADEIQELATKEIARLSAEAIHDQLATPEKKNKVEIGEDRLQQEIRAILQGKDLAQTSLKEVRADLEGRLGLSAGSLDSRRDEIKDLATKEIEKLSSAAVDDELPLEELATPEKKKKVKKDAQDHKAGANKATQAGITTRQQFLSKAKKFSVTVGEKTFQVEPKKFATGTCGFFQQLKVPFKIGDETLSVLCQINCTVIGSKEWQDE